MACFHYIIGVLMIIANFTELTCFFLVEHASKHDVSVLWIDSLSSSWCQACRLLHKTLNAKPERGIASATITSIINTLREALQPPSQKSASVESTTQQPPKYVSDATSKDHYLNKFHSTGSRTLLHSSALCRDELTQHHLAIRCQAPTQVSSITTEVPLTSKIRPHAMQDNVHAPSASSSNVPRAPTSPRVYESFYCDASRVA